MSCHLRYGTVQYKVLWSYWYGTAGRADGALRSDARNTRKDRIRVKKPRNPSGLHRCENTRPTFASQIYIPCLSRGETDKGEANDGVDPLKREEDVEVGVTKSRGNKL